MLKPTRVETQTQIFISTPRSSWLSSMVYDKDLRTLTVTGHNTKTNSPIIYGYCNVSSFLFSDLEDKVMGGESAGRAFNQMIKPNCPVISRP